MKKSFFCLGLLLVLISSVLMASDNVPYNGYLLDLGFSPFNLSMQNSDNSDGIDFNNNPIILKQFLFRKIVNKTLYYRIGLNLDYTSFSEENPNEFEINKSSFLMGIETGFERHSSPSDKLSPYWGGLVGLQYETYKQNSKSTGDYFSEMELDNAWISENNWEYANDSDIVKRESTQVSVKGIIGCDYYFSKNIYLGIDAQYGLSMKMYPAVEAKIKTENNQGDPDTNTNELSGKASSLAFGKTARGMLHVGFKFK